jgi:hypothetical protein
MSADCMQPIAEAQDAVLQDEAGLGLLSVTHQGDHRATTFPHAMRRGSATRWFIDVLSLDLIASRIDDQRGRPAAHRVHACGNENRPAGDKPAGPFD